MYAKKPAGVRVRRELPWLVRVATLLSALLSALLLSACASVSKDVDATGQAARRFDPKDFAKSNIDRIADAHRTAAFASLRLLAEKLYKRNPREWRKSGYDNAEAGAEALFDPRMGWRHPALGAVRGTDAVLLGLREDYTGDRVAAVICGLGGMFNDAYDNKTEFFLTDQLDAQKLYHSARNLEIAAWKLANARDASGTLLLLSNETGPAGQPPNLSFEREFGKLIGNFDLLALAIADRYNRSIAWVAQNIATAIFLPIGALN
jgi:hypothetical protein